MAGIAGSNPRLDVRSRRAVGRGDPALVPMLVAPVDGVNVYSTAQRCIYRDFPEAQNKKWIHLVKTSQKCAGRTLKTQSPFTQVPPFHRAMVRPSIKVFIPNVLAVFVTVTLPLFFV